MELIPLQGTTDYAILPRTCVLYRYVVGQHWEEVVASFNEEYPYWMIEYPGGWQKVYCHQLVANMFLYRDPSVPNLVVNHKDGNKRNWNMDNLEWITQQENVLHAHRLGLTKATPIETVFRIKRLLKSGRPVKEIAEMCGVHYQTVFDIKTGRRHAQVQV